MNKLMNFKKNQQGNIDFKVMFAVIALVSVIAISWFSKSPDEEMKAQIKDVETQSMTQAQESIQKDEIDSNAEAQQSDLKSDALFNDLWEKIHDPKLREGLTARQILDSPEFNQLSTEQMQKIVNAIVAMLKNKELDNEAFMANFSRKDSPSFEFENGIKEVVPGQRKKEVVLAPATPEQALAMDNVRQLLRNQESEKPVTAAELLKMPEVLALPMHLRSELAEEAVAMIARGELDGAVFLAPQKEVAPVEVDEEIKRSEVTYEQWEAFDEIQTQLNGDDFSENTSLAQILTSPEYKTLPPYLREKISAAVVAKLEK